jgi:hypothetical protein
LDAQASRHEEAMRRQEEAMRSLHESLTMEKAALQHQFEAKLQAVEGETAAQKADFEARMLQALARTEVRHSQAND